MTVRDYSTTRLLTDQKPACFDTSVDGFQSVIKLSDHPQKLAEGGLRLLGRYKACVTEKPLLTVITVVYNGLNYIEGTLNSVLGQTYDNVEYIVIDGGSVDGTTDIIRKYDQVLDYWVSEPDRGMYDALAKGFSLASGEIICYLNAGDFYFDRSLEAVANIYNDTACYWFTGLRSVSNEQNVVTGVDQPFRYISPLIRQGFYGRKLPFIQQESTFWHRKLLSSIDMSRLKKMRLAGDYYLWFCFSQVLELSVVRAQLGVFKIHEGQLSEELNKYWSEVDEFKNGFSFSAFFLYLLELPFWALSPAVRKYIFNGYYFYDDQQRRWVTGAAVRRRFGCGGSHNG